MMNRDHNKHTKEKRDIRIVFLVFTAICALMGKKLFPGLFSYLFFGAGAVLLLMVVVAPLTLRPLFVRWMRFAHLLGRINTQILLFIFYVVVMLPVGIVMRLLGRDPMQRTIAETGTYWESYEAAGERDRARYERQF